MTGAVFSRLFGEKIDKAYSNYLSPTEENDLHKQAMYATITDVYNELSTQGSYDDILPIIKTNQVFAINANQIYVSPIPISNVVGVFANTIISTPIPHNLEIGDFIKIENVAGITSAINATFFVTSFLHSATQYSITHTLTGAYTAGSGEITLTQNAAATLDKQINDYWALLALKAKYIQQIQVAVSEASNAAPIRITVDKVNNIKTGEKLNLSNFAGNTNANGDHYVKKINTYKFDLYSDKDLLTPIAGNGTYSGSGKVSRVYYKDATPYFSNRQISEYSKPEINYPQFDRGDNLIKVLPNDRACQEITVDYISTPPVDIDVSNTVIDLENYFHFDFLIMIMEKSAKMFFDRSKDMESLQADVMLEQQKAP